MFSTLSPRLFFCAKKILIFTFLLSLFSNTLFAAPESLTMIIVSANEVGNDIRFAYANSNLGSILVGGSPTFPKSKKKTKRTHPDLVRVEIVQGPEMTIPQGEAFDLTAIGYSVDGSMLSGIKFDWTVEDVGRGSGARNLPSGTFLPRLLGNFVVKARADGIVAQMSITVQENRAFTMVKRLLEQEAQGDLTLINRLKLLNRYSNGQISSKINYLVVPNPVKNIFETTVAPEPSSQPPNHGPSATQLEYDAGALETSSKSRVMRPADEDGWNGSNWWMADDPENQTGNPPGTSPESAGNGNFQFSAPVVNLPGRGMDVNLALNYNSRVWSKSGNLMKFDSERGYPAPGWNLGFGKMLLMGATGGCMLVDADGTNRGYTGSLSNYNYGSYGYISFSGHTTDGTFIDYSCGANTYNGAATSMWGYASLPNGTTVSYSISSANKVQAFPTRISDAQGNYMDVSYRNNTGPQLNTITDTLGRVITFNYDSSNRLISVEVPKMDNAGTRTAVRIHYKQLTLNAGWAYPVTGDTNNTAPYVIDAIYYPGTNTGYWFNDADSYSSYGMIAKLLEHRGMSWTGSAGDQGTVTSGTMTKQAVYNYPLTPTYTLTDAPTYSTQTETWDGMDTSAAVTGYSINMNSSPRTITVTQPNGLKSKQYMYKATGQWYDGLIYQDEALDASNNVLSKSVVTWGQGAYDSPRPTETNATDERSQILKTTYTYGTVYNQLTSQKTYDYNGTTLLKEARNVYENNANYTGRHIFNLVKTAEIYDGAGGRVSKTDYEYDNNAVVNGTANHNLKATPGVAMHYSYYDPYTSETMDGPDCASSHYEYQWCDDGYGGGYSCPVEVCDTWYPVSVYNPSTLFRGNVTKTTVYSDAAAATGAIAQTKQYDTTGNLVAESASCCELKTYEFTSATQYAYPTTKTRGSSDPNSTLRNTVTAIFDFSTGLLKQSTDANGKTVTTTYNADSLRPTQTTSSTGAYSTSVYNDAAMTVTNETRLYGGAIASSSVAFLNGIGKTKREEAAGTGGITDIVETKYTNQGQVWKTSRPYRTGDPVQWQEIVYDLLGRTSQVIEPDGSTSKGFYNEATPPTGASASPGTTFRSVDAWGRERWERKDALGRLVEVAEPKTDGNGAFQTTGNLITSYAYNLLDKLTQSNQGGQVRTFKYDSVGRMTRQKLAEQSATISDSGAYIGAGGVWSSAVTYDDRSNVVQRVDPRGVKINYSYQLSGADDPFNRIQGISYDLSGLHDTSKPIAIAPSVSYEYMTTGDQSRIKKITTTGILTEDFAYDGEGRVSDYTQTIANRTSYPLVTSYAYDSLDRVASLRYPAQYGLAGSPRKLTENLYDAANRLSSFKVDSQEVAGTIAYNAASQITSIKIGPSGTNQVTENYTFDAQTGLLTNQQAIKNGSTLLNLTYDYARNNSAGNTNTSWKTGAVTKILNNLDHNKDREYQFDALGRLTVAKGKSSNQWTQTYAYDRYGNRTSVTATGTAADGYTPMPTDGMASATYNSANNQITTPAFEYDVAGNQTKALAEDGVTWLRYEYDSANRIQAVRKDDANQTLVESYQYGSGNARLMTYTQKYSTNSMYLNIDGRTVAEYAEYTLNTPTWVKSNIYLGTRQLAVISTNGSGGEFREYNHPDKLGTRLVTDQSSGGSYEQVNLPFGTGLTAESTGNTTKRFTSYERSSQTGLDYAQNRTYDSKQGRFTQVDPIGMGAASLSNPQSLNMYSYVGNDPVNRTDPTGLFWGWLKKLFKAILQIVLFVALYVAFVALATIGVGLILAGGIINIIAGIAVLVAASFFAVKIGATVYTKIKEWIHRCNVPDFSGLSQARQDELSQRGVTPDQWNALRNNQRLGWFNIVAAIAAAGLSLIGWLVDWARGGIQQDRTFFKAGPGATNLYSQVMSSSIFSRSNGHKPNYPDGYRFNSLTRSLQLSFASDGMRFDADIDSFNPERGPFGFLGHAYEVVSHILGRIFGGTKTSPYSVGSRSNWECK